MAKYRSVAERSEEKVIIKGFISRVGLTDKSATVYRILGLGYWIAPIGISIIAADSGNGRIVSKASLNGTRAGNSTMLRNGSLAAVKEGIAKVLRYQDGILGLFSASVNHRWLDEHQFSTSPHGDGFLVQVAAAVAVQDVYNRTNYIGCYTDESGSERLELEKKAIQLKREMVALFRKRYQLTVEEALTFHKENPLLKVVE